MSIFCFLLLFFFFFVFARSSIQPTTLAVTQSTTQGRGPAGCRVGSSRCSRHKPQPLRLQKFPSDTSPHHWLACLPPSPLPNSGCAETARSGPQPACTNPSPPPRPSYLTHQVPASWCFLRCSDRCASAWVGCASDEPRGTDELEGKRGVSCSETWRTKKKHSKS